MQINAKLNMWIGSQIAQRLIYVWSKKGSCIIQATLIWAKG